MDCLLLLRGASRFAGSFAAGFFVAARGTAGFLRAPSDASGTSSESDELELMLSGTALATASRPTRCRLDWLTRSPTVAKVLEHVVARARRSGPAEPRASVAGDAQRRFPSEKQVDASVAIPHGALRESE
jgi:hypothetical protein